MASLECSGRAASQPSTWSRPARRATLKRAGQRATMPPAPSSALEIAAPRLVDHPGAIRIHELAGQRPVVVERLVPPAGEPARVGKRLACVERVAEQPQRGARRLVCATRVAGSDERLGKRQLGATVPRVEADGRARSVHALRGLRRVEALPRLGEQPVGLARVVAREAAELGRRVPMCADRGEDLREQLPVPNLVGVEPHRRLRVLLRVCGTTEREQGPRPELVRRVVAGPRGELSRGEAR